MRRLLMWPSTPENDYEPWYKIVWRSFWFCPYFVLMWCAAMCVLLGWGLVAARAFLMVGVPLEIRGGR